MDTTAAVSDDWLEDCLDNVNVPGTLHVMMTSSQHKTILRKEERKLTDGMRLASRPHSTPLTLKWLEENYEIAEGVCIPRSTLYVHYLDYCSHSDTQPVNAASFGKIIRQQFPQITTRRLGTRGQSKYHYYGIGVKETSKYYEIIFSRKGIQSVSDCKKEVVKQQIVSYSPRCKTSTLLPQFPSVNDVSLTPDVTADKVSTFLMMYRTHCQRILDTVIRANFDEVQSFLVHFWQGMPQHILPILGSPSVVSLIGVCDSILYKTISTVLMPSILQPVPDSLTQVIRKFARQLDEWLKNALEDVPVSLQKTKIDLARRFAQILKRQTSLNHLCQAARSVVQSNDVTNQMLSDWSRIDLAGICKQTMYTMDKYRERDYEMIVTLSREFEDLLHDKAPLEAYTDWLDSMVSRCVIQPATRRPQSAAHVSRQFLLMWSCFGTRVIRDMTLQSAPSFGSFHLLHLMFDDYVMYVVESLQSQERYTELLNTITGQQHNNASSSTSCLSDSGLPTPVSMTSATSMTSPCDDVKQPISSIQFASAQCERQSVITDARELNYNSTTTPTTYCTSTPRPVITSQQSSTSCSSPASLTMTSYDSRIRQMSPPVDDINTNNLHSKAISANYSDQYDNKTLRTMNHNNIDISSYSMYSYAQYAQYGYRSRDYYCSPDWSEYQQRYNALNMASQAHGGSTNQLFTYGNYGRNISDYDVTAYGYDNSTGSVVAYGGSHVISDKAAAYARQCAVATATDHVTSTYVTDRDDVQTVKSKRSRVPDMTSPEVTSSLVDRSSGYQLSAAAAASGGQLYKRQRFVDYGMCDGYDSIPSSAYTAAHTY